MGKRGPITNADRREAVCDYIERFYAEHGYSPPVRAIGQALGVPFSSVFLDCDRLVDDGRLLRIGGSRGFMPAKRTAA